VPLTALTLKDNLQFFHDEKTKELYSYFPGKEEPELEDESLLREAEEKTTLNSHFSASKYKSFRNNVPLSPYADRTERSYEGCNSARKFKLDRF
jgi:hypothetical protein